MSGSNYSLYWDIRKAIGGNYGLYWDIREAIVSDVSNAVDSVSFVPIIDDINKILNRAPTVLINSSVEDDVRVTFDEVIEDYEYE